MINFSFSEKGKEFPKKTREYIKNHDLIKEVSVLIFVFVGLSIGTVVSFLIGLTTGQFGLFRFFIVSLLAGYGAIGCLILAGVITNRILSKMGLLS